MLQDILNRDPLKLSIEKIDDQILNILVSLIDILNRV